MPINREISNPLIPPPDYGVLTLKEVAKRLNCTPLEVKAREAEGLLFSLGSGLKGMKGLFPAFQLDPRLDQDLLAQIIKKYDEFDHLGVSKTQLWVFLRAPNSMFSWQTQIDMLLGASPPGWEVLSDEDRYEALMDVVREELSRIVW